MKIDFCVKTVFCIKAISSAVVESVRFIVLWITVSGFKNGLFFLLFARFYYRLWLGLDWALGRLGFVYVVCVYFRAFSCR